MSDIPFSEKYRHDLKALYEEHTEEKITGKQLSQRVDELNRKEARLHKSTARVLLLRELEEARKEIESEVEEEARQRQLVIEAEQRAIREEQRRLLQKQQRQQLEEAQRAQQDKTKKANEQLAFRQNINSYLFTLEVRAQGYGRWFFVLQCFLIFFSAATATMASMDVVPRWVVSITGFVAAIVGTLLTTFKIQERIYTNRKAIAEIKLECQRYDYKTDKYNDVSSDEAYLIFSDEIRTIQSEQMLQEVELWNPKQEERSTQQEEKSTSADKENKENEETENKENASHEIPDK